MDYPIGTYVCVSPVYIRKEPRIVENTSGNNRVGQLTAGTKRYVFETLTNNDNTTWGRISEFDSAGKAEWVCIVGLNRKYMEFTEPSKHLPIEDRLSKLEAWAKTQGYKG